jgi:hypothetical protein
MTLPKENRNERPVPSLWTLVAGVHHLRLQLRQTAEQARLALVWRVFPVVWLIAAVVHLAMRCD